MITKSELKANVEATGSLFFTRNSMKFFGDTMTNYGVRKTTIIKDDQEIEAYELYRKQAVKHGLKSSVYFDVVTFKRLHV